MKILQDLIGFHIKVRERGNCMFKNPKAKNLKTSKKNLKK
jgi:hypothetical protein